ncbi:solute carrier family 13 member 2 isoform X2 [Notamacropus eugenii]|uniref:solute carrier family 13 member 2 isoform X2 n=1 Tax=Notamacropus eugenii TaxID=9315 RepID=UPI003B67BEE7
MANVGQVLWAYRKYLMSVLFPILLLPLPLVVPGKEAKCGYTIILMALLWCTEALPLAVTAFLPLVLFPMMAIMDASEVCMEYLQDTSILFIGGLLVAIAVEKWNLHKRIALRVLLFIGVKPTYLILGFMLITAFLSMWISNTATTAMMVPIAHAVMEQLHKAPKQNDGEVGNVNISFELQEPNYPITEKEAPKLDEKDSSPVPPPVPVDLQKDKEQVKFSQGISLCICYASSIGGIATLTGTSPNLVLQGQVNSFRKNFSCRGKAHEQEREAYQVIRNEHKKLGPMSFAEKAVSFLFVLLVVLWFTREPGFFHGWGNAAFPNDKGESMLSDGSVAFFIGILLFIIPSEFPGCTQQEGTQGKFKAPPALLNWNIVNKKMPWNIVFLLGGGFALAKGSETSGLSQWLGDKLTPLQSIPSPAIAFILCIIVAAFTECTSNVATTTLFLPILASMAQAICLNPLYVMLPCTVASSLAFMLPVATPPNAIVFSFGQLRVCDMAKAGFLLNIFGVLVISLAINTWANPIFGLDQFPDWAQSNITTSCKVNNQFNTSFISP